MYTDFLCTLPLWVQDQQGGQHKFFATSGGNRFSKSLHPPLSRAAQGDNDNGDWGGGYDHANGDAFQNLLQVAQDEMDDLVNAQDDHDGDDKDDHGDDVNDYYVDDTFRIMISNR